jgi:hypothetical protein
MPVVAPARRVAVLLAGGLGRAEEAYTAYLAALRLRPDSAEIRRRLQRLPRPSSPVTEASGFP